MNACRATFGSSALRFTGAFLCCLALGVARVAAQGVPSDLQTYFAARTQPFQTTSTFTFVTTGDIHVSRNATRVLTPAQWQSLVASWRDSGYLFGLVIGDLGYGAYTDVLDVAAGVSQTPNAPPVFYSMGNHEIDAPAGKRAWIDALYPGAVPASRWTPTVASPGNSDRAYWSFNVGPYWHFIVLDADMSDPATGSDIQNSLGAAQRAWLAADLQANSTRNVFVFVHEPIDQARYDTPDYTLNDRAAFMELLAAHPKQKFIFSGHLHGYRGITKWKGITSVHTSDTNGSPTSGVKVAVVGETATVSWPGMTSGDIVEYDQAPMYQVTTENGLNVLKVAEDGTDAGQTRLEKMGVVGPQGGVTPTSGSLMLFASNIDWYKSFFISEQLVKIQPGMKLSYDLHLKNVQSGMDAIAVQPNWVMLDDSLPPVIRDQNGIALSQRPRDGSYVRYNQDLPGLGGRATGTWYHREFDLTPLAGHYVDGFALVGAATAVNVGTAYADRIRFTWPPPATCTGSLSPSTQTSAAVGGALSVTITAAATCNWTAISNASWIAVTAGASGTGNGTTTLMASTNTDLAQRIGTVTIANQSFTVTQAGPADTTPPDTTITAAPPATDATPTATFSFTSTEMGSTFVCRLDASAATTCSSPWTYTSLASGTHTFTVAATDAAGNTDPTPAIQTWTVGTALPETTITATPGAISGVTATFSFTSTIAGSTFSCTLDGATGAACVSPRTYTTLTPGTHTFTVVAAAPGGNADPTPATFTWTVDATPPDTTLTATPSPIGGTSGSFSFTSTETGSTFRCTIDGAAPVVCSSPLALTNLAGGTHTFTVVATDAVGNVDPSSAAYTWTVDATAPQTTITAQPPATSGGAVSFSFVSTETGSSFRCTLDAGAATTCTSPTTYNNLTNGSHSFTVAATDSVGNADPTPATYSWTVGVAQPTVGVISIDFVGTGSAMASSDSAGVVAKPLWNNATGASRTTALALVDETSSATTAGVTWTSDNGGRTPVKNQAGDRRMMRGYLDNGAGRPTTVTVTGLTGTYDVYVYADGDNAANTRTGAYQISGPGITATTINLTDAGNANFNGTFTQASNSNGNYVKFSSVAATGFTLTATPGVASDGQGRAPVNGIQIVPK